MKQMRHQFTSGNRSLFYMHGDNTHTLHKRFNNPILFIVSALKENRSALGMDFKSYVIENVPSYAL